ncbi:hypothetical protein ACHAWF_001843 [Thalassiosira exigua]
MSTSSGAGQLSFQTLRLNSHFHRARADSWLSIVAIPPHRIPPAPMRESMQHQPGRDAHVEAGRAAAVLRDAHEAVAQLHLLRRHARTLVPHHEGGRRRERLVLQVDRRFVDLHPQDRHGRPRIPTIVVVGVGFVRRLVAARHAFDVLRARLQLVEPHDPHPAPPDAFPDRRRHVRALGVGIELERALSDDEDGGTAVRGRELEEVPHVLALGYVGEDEVRLGTLAPVTTPARFARRIAPRGLAGGRGLVHGSTAGVRTETELPLPEKVATRSPTSDATTTPDPFRRRRSKSTRFVLPRFYELDLNMVPVQLRTAGCGLRLDGKVVNATPTRRRASHND